MQFDYGYKCKQCGKIYHKKKIDLPILCVKCGEEIIKERRSYNYTSDGRKTYNTNLFGGYDYIETILGNVEKVVLYKKYPFSKWKEKIN